MTEEELLPAALGSAGRALVIPKRRFFRVHPRVSWAPWVLVCVVVGATAQLCLLAVPLVNQSAQLLEIGPILVLWAVVPVLGATSLLWNLKGREVLSIEGETFVIRREIAGIGRARRFSLKAIERVTAVELSRTEFAECCWGFGVGQVRVGVARKQYSFGIGVSHAEAERLSQQLLRLAST